MKSIILLTALIWAAAPGFAHRIRVDFDHGTQFSRFKTYRLVPVCDAQGRNSIIQNQLVQNRIGGFIEEALAARGLKRTNSGEDLQVRYRVDVIEQPVFTTFSDSWGWGPGWGWNGVWGGWGPGWGTGLATTTVQMYYEGVLVVDMVDTHRQKLVFQGTSSQSVSSRPEKNNRKLAKAVSEVFAKYPPQP
jgi:hypothetical protein